MTQPLPDQLRSAVRYLGRVLGDVIRAQDGQAVFDQIEDIRRASVAFHREGTDEAARLMGERLAALSLAETVRFAHPLPASCRSPTSPRIISSAAAAGPATPVRTPWPARCAPWAPRASTPRRCASFWAAP